MSKLQNIPLCTETLSASNAREYWNNRWARNQTGWKADELAGKSILTRNMMDSMKALMTCNNNTIDKNNCELYLSDEKKTDFVINGLSKIATAQGHGTTAPRCNLHAFVPLCGDSSIISYLAEMFDKTVRVSSRSDDKGNSPDKEVPSDRCNRVHLRQLPSVTGVDLSLSALENVMKEQFPGREFTSVAIKGHHTGENCTLYETGAGESRIDDPSVVVRLFHGDIFDFSHYYHQKQVEGLYSKLSVVYDRAAMVALSPINRGPYVHEVIQPLLASNSYGDIPSPFIFLELASREEGKRDSGPPYHIPIDMVMSAEHGYDPEKWAIQLLDTDPSEEPWAEAAARNGTGTDRPFIFYRTVLHMKAGKV
eukprot:Tbor_TRINITY_DN3860_c0_g1::TRINITY_DN3860_c0_g1_i1::g.5593::m.5593